MKVLKYFTFVFALMFLPMCNQAKAENVSLKTAWLAEYEAFPAWFAQKNGMDAKNGLVLVLDFYQTGKNLIDNMESKGNVIGACGSIPAILGTLNGNLSIIGVANNEAASNVIYVKEDSPLRNLSKQNASQIKGQNFLLSLGTSAHQLVNLWLNQMGVNLKDVNYIDTVAEEAIPAFKNGLGEAVALWAPMSYQAEEEGFRALLTGEDLGINQYILILAENSFIEKNEKLVSAFLTTYFEAVEAIKAMPEKELISSYQAFYKEVAKSDISVENVRKELKNHILYSKEDQKDILTKSTENNNYKWLEEVITFHEENGRLRKADIKKIRSLDGINTDFIN